MWFQENREKKSNNSHSHCGSLLVSSPDLLLMMKWAGTPYLAGLGVQTIRGRGDAIAVAFEG